MLMNNYGYFIYNDYTAGITININTSVAKQQNSLDLVNGNSITPVGRPTGFRKYASFEKGEFDFKKPLYIAPDEDMPFTTTIISDMSGAFATDIQFSITTGDEPSGSGIGIYTLNDDYTVEITIEDSEGTRTKTFRKNDEEYYDFPYVGLSAARVKLIKTEPYHFAKVLGFSLGKCRQITENELLEEPEINNYFSITGEELPYDTLDITLMDNHYSFVRGQKITYTRTGQRFFVDNSVPQSDGTVNVTCYGDVYNLETDFHGVMRLSGDVELWVKKLLKGDSNNTVDVSSKLYEFQTFSGAIGLMSYREAARIMLFGNGLRVRRGTNTHLEVFSPYHHHEVEAIFNANNIVSVPNADVRERYSKLSFTTHSYRQDRKDGRVEAFRDELPTSYTDLSGEKHDMAQIEFGEPFTSLKFYTVRYNTDDGKPKKEMEGNTAIAKVENADDVEETRVEIQLSPTEKTPFYVEFFNTANQIDVLITGYPYVEKTKTVHTKTKLPEDYYSTLEIEDTTVLFDDDTTGLLRALLRYFFKFYRVMTFDSVLDAEAGHYARIDLNGEKLYGWITQKIDRMNGVYSYEVACK